MKKLFKKLYETIEMNGIMDKTSKYSENDIIFGDLSEELSNICELEEAVKDPISGEEVSDNKSAISALRSAGTLERSSGVNLRKATETKNPYDASQLKMKANTLQNTANKLKTIGKAETAVLEEDVVENLSNRIAAKVEADRKKDQQYQKDNMHREEEIQKLRDTKQRIVAQQKSSIGANTSGTAQDSQATTE